MSEPAFRAQFKDIRIELPRPMLKSFIHKLLSSNYKLTWRHDKNGIELVIQTGEDRLLIPMKLESERKTLVEVKELEVITEELALSIEDLITDCGGSGVVRTFVDGIHCVSYFDQGKIVSVLKTEDGEEITAADSVSSISTQNKNQHSSIKQFVVNAEIDYYLMELKEALDKNDLSSITHLKKILSRLALNKKQLSSVKSQC
ncbi:hypothetical protein K8O68_21220 [Salipaludibacillus sp. CUR1]|uniref:hypothetical protein n=1 Tax=Salipaludibacillus sp. CUR1 TaxID=2820003 RepID=UPI001E45843F|nr:hypothetical protein [Salipaludibacillus sp. CUR1]MCE7794914.1 hypothetical protein [Salipaludibacillus sp. CUR1]